MSPDYSWLANPDGSNAPEAVVSDMRELADAHERDLVIANFLKLEPERYWQMREDGISMAQLLEERGISEQTFANFMRQLDHPTDISGPGAATRFAANVEFTTGKQILRVRGALDKGFRKWATDAVQSKLYRYHKREFETPQEMFDAVFEELPEGSTTRVDVEFIAGKLFQFATTHGLDHVDRLWGDGTIAKARAAVPLLRDIIESTEPAAIAQAQAIVDDVLQLTDIKFKAKYKPVPVDEPSLRATDYSLPRGGILVIEYGSGLDRLTIERRMGGSLEWHAGSGHEAVLSKLARMSAAAARRRKPNALRKVKARKKRK